MRKGMISLLAPHNIAHEATSTPDSQILTNHITMDPALLITA